MNTNQDYIIQNIKIFAYLVNQIHLISLIPLYQFVILKDSSLFNTLSISVSSPAVLLPLLPFSLILSLVRVILNSKAILLIIQKVPLINLTIRLRVDSKATSFILHPVTFVYSTIRPSICALSFLEAFFEVTNIDCAIALLQGTLAVLTSIFIPPFEGAALKIIKLTSFRKETVLLAILPCSLVLNPFNVDLLSFAMHLAVSPIAGVATAIWPGVGTLALKVIAQP